MTIAVIFAAFLLFYAAAGWSAFREYRGSPQRLLRVSAGLASLSCLPLAIQLVRQWREPEQLVLLVLPAVISVMVLRPARRSGARPLPPLEDGSLLERVATLAARTRVAVPAVRSFSTSGHQFAMAAVTSLAAPVLILSDGLLHRFEPEEQDAIIGHELGHLENDSLWLQPVAASLGALGAGLLETGGHFTSAGPLLLFASAAIQQCVHVILNRPVELGCDLAGARMVGFAAMARGLDKIHAVHFVNPSGWGARLLYAIATHPHPALRYEHLRKHSAGELPLRTSSDAVIAEQRRLSVSAFVILVAMVVCAVLLPVVARLGLMTAALAATYAAWFVATHRFRARLRARYRPRNAGARMFVAALAFLAGGLAAPDSISSLARHLYRAGWFHTAQSVRWIPPLLIWIGVFGVAASALVINRRTRLELRLAALLDRNDYQGAVAAADRRRRIVMSDPALRYRVAVWRLLTGDREGANAEIDTLSSKGQPAALLARASLERRHDTARALAHARRAVKSLPDDAGALAILVLLLRDEGRTAEAATLAAQPLVDVDSPEGAHLEAVRGLLALDGGDPASAGRHVRAALQLSPGDPFVLLRRAEIAIASRDAEAGTAVAQAREAARRNPFSLAEDDVAELERALST